MSRPSVARTPARLTVLLLVLLMVAVAPGGAYAADPGPDDASATLLALPDDADLAALASRAVDDTVSPFEGEIDMATLQEDALARLGTLSAAEYEGPALALALAFDPRAAFVFVRDRIGFDPYRGLLRGGLGALAARSGNSYDRAALLRELLGQMAIPTRFAIGQLSQQQAADVVSRSFAPPVQPLAITTPETEAALDRESIATRAGRDYSRLREALGGRLSSMGTADGDAALEDVRSHAWLQVFLGTDWVDFDPTFPDAEPGDRLTEPTLTVDEIPTEEIPSVTIRMEAQTYDGSALRSGPILTRSLPAWQAADTQILLSFQPEIAGVGGGILEALGSAGNFVPHVMVAGTDYAGEPFPVRPGTDIFTGEIDDGLETARIRLEIGISVPGHEDVVASRMLLDRVPAGALIAADGVITDLELLPMEEDAAGPIDLQPVWHLMVSSGASSPWLNANDRVNVISFLNELQLYPDAIGAFGFGDQLWPITVANQALVLGAERSAIAAIDAAPAVRALVAEPRVYVVSWRGSPDRPLVTTDLVHDAITVLEEPGAPAGSAARAELWYGALQAAAETEFLRVLMSGFGGGTVESTSTASAARLTAFDRPADPALDGAPASLLAALDAGQVVIVPGEPSTAPGWWTVDPRDGSTRSVDRSGRGWGGGAGAGSRGGKPISTPSGDPNRFKYKPTGRTPTPTCTRANEYMTPIGCVSLPAAIAFWGLGGLTAVGFAWGATMLWQAAIGYGE